jgi:UDP-glucose:(heptosyl)LPS alpha-1,3-glucosyltransferase
VKLGVLLDRFDPRAGGAEAHTDALLKRAVERGDAAAIACIEGEPPAGVEKVAVSAPRRRPARDEALAVEGEKALRAAGCDVVLAIRHAYACDVYLPHGGLVLDALAAHDAAEGPPGWFARTFGGALAKREFFLEAERVLLSEEEGPKVIALSNALKARIAAVYPHAKPRTFVIPNGVDSDRFDPAPFREGRAAERARLHLPQIGYVGLLLGHSPLLKGLDAVLEAATRPEVTALDPEFHLLVAGKRAGAEVTARARALGLEERVRAIGPIADPRPLYAAADVLCLPTFHDPCSLVTLEALSMGLPVITTPRNGAWELMAMRGGICVEAPGDAEGVAVALRVLADPDVRAQTSEDARYVARKNRLTTRLDQVLDVCRGAAKK